MQEKPHVQYILSLLKDLIPNPSSISAGLDSRYPRRLPTYTSLILMHSLRGIFHPSNFIYPLTSRFLLQRPSLDTSDVPMLYGMLYSSSDDNWKKERAWIIRFLADGMVSSEDWKVLKRRHTWDLLSSLFQSSEGDSVLRLGILEVCVLSLGWEGCTLTNLYADLGEFDMQRSSNNVFDTQIGSSALGRDAASLNWHRNFECPRCRMDQNP